MVDLVLQYQTMKSEIDTAILNVIENAQFINGPEVTGFKAEMENYLAVKEQKFGIFHTLCLIVKWVKAAILVKM